MAGVSRNSFLTPSTTNPYSRWTYFCRLVSFCRTKLPTAEGRQGFRWTMKAARRLPEWATEDPRQGHRGTGRAPTPGRAGPASGPPRSQPRAAPGAALGWQLSAASSPYAIPSCLVSKRELLTLQELHSCPWPGLECLLPPSAEGLSVPQSRVESPASTKHLQALTACCWAALPPKRSASRRFRRMFLLASESCFLSQGDRRVPRGKTTL